jgi:transcriptional regulator with XRE-family HTH domain
MAKRDIIGKAIRNTSAESKRRVRLSMDIANHLNELLLAHKMTQKALAKKLNKQNSEISKWLSGTHNFTLDTLSKIESVFGEHLVFSKREAFEKFSPFSASKHSRHKPTTKVAKPVNRKENTPDMPYTAA